MRTMTFVITTILNLYGVVVAQNTNKVDSLGQKQGLWIVNDGRAEVYYRNDTLNGVFRSYNRKTGKLSGFGEYDKGERRKNWFLFDNQSRLTLIESDIKINSNTIRFRDDGDTLKPKYISHVKFFYPSGVIKEEGNVLYDENIEIDYYKTGQWLVYDEDGKQIKVEKY